MGPQHHTFERLAGVDVLVTVVRGREDAFSPAMFAPKIAEALPDGRLEDHPELGHFGPLEDPATIAASSRSVPIDRTNDLSIFRIPIGNARR